MCVKQMLSAITLVYLMGIVDTSGDTSVWTDIKISVTNIAKSFGVPRAGAECIDVLGEINTCKEVSFMECDPIIDIGGLLGAGECRVQSWVVFFTLALFVLIPIGILSSICCICVCR